MSQSDWASLQIVRIAFLLCFLPVLLYRIWRLWRYPTSVPAIAATAFGFFVWLWLVAFTDLVWSAMPPVIRAVSAGGWWTVSIAGCLQVFVVGIRGDASPARIRRGLRITFAVTAIALIAVTVAASHSEFLLTTSDLFMVMNALGDDGDSGSNAAAVASNGFAAVVFIQLAWVGSRHADRTPVGTGLGLLAAASLFELVSVIDGGILGPLGLRGGLLGGTCRLWVGTIAGCVGAILVITGFLWPPVILRIQARRDESRLRPLRGALAGLFPQLSPPLESRIRLSDKVFEWSTHIQDGLTLLAQGRQVPLETDHSAPARQAERVVDVANWIVGQSVPGFSAEWLRPPVGMSDEDWVLAIADAYRAREEGLAAQPLSSGRPSTLRR